MAEGNGGGNSRMDRIERAIEAIAEETRMLLRSQVAQQGLVEDWRNETRAWRDETQRLDREARDRDQALGERIERLVVAIGEFVAKQGR